MATPRATTRTHPIGFTVLVHPPSQPPRDDAVDLQRREQDRLDGASAPSHQARLGQVTVKSDTFQTPCLLVHTGKGCSPNVTWDALERLHTVARQTLPDATLACQLDVLQLVHQQVNVESYIRSLPPGKSPKSFLGMPDTAVLVATPRNPTTYEHQGMTRKSNSEHASFMTFQGASSMRPEEYIVLASGLGADVVVLLGDEVTSDARKNRVVESSKRTIEWVERQLAVLHTNKESKESKESNGSNGSNGSNHEMLVLCPVVGGGGEDYVRLRRDAVTYNTYASSDATHGVYVSGLGTGESVEVRLGVLREVIRRIPTGKLRMTSGVSNPVEVLEAVGIGVDVFDTAYVEMVTRAGLALCFPTDGVGAFAATETAAHREGRDEGRDEGREGEQFTHHDGTKLNLWSTRYKLDRSPMVHDCPCGSCREHTRGYVHHLLVTHEMTAWVLLEQHNVYHMQRFFASIRKAIREGVFDEYRDAFVGYVRACQRQ